MEIMLEYMDGWTDGYVNISWKSTLDSLWSGQSSMPWFVAENPDIDKYTNATH